MLDNVLGLCDVPKAVWANEVNRKARLISDDYRRFCQVARGSREWNILYSLRGSVERVFGRLKGFGALDGVTLGGLDKVELHCLLSVTVMQAMALGKAKQKALSELRNNVRKVA